MKKSLPIFLQACIVCIGIVTLGLMLWFPHLEGRNADATLFRIYFNDPFLAYAYVASISFFAALYQAFRLLGHVAHGKAFSLDSVRALRTIKRCALCLIAFVVGAEAYFFMALRGQEDIAGGVMMGLVIILICAVAAVTATMLERILQSIVGISKAVKDRFRTF